MLLPFLKRIFAFALFVSATLVVCAQAEFDFDARVKSSNGDFYAAAKSVLADISALGGKPAKLKFSKQTYRLGYCEREFTFLNLQKISNLEIDGCGATLVVDCANSFLKIDDCDRVGVKNFTVVYEPCPFTQGRIVGVGAGEFILKIDAGYPMLPDAAAAEARYGAKTWRWGSVMDSAKRCRKEGVSDHFFIDTVLPTDKKGTYTIRVTADYVERLKGVCVGDRFAMPVPNMRDNPKSSFTPNASVVNSADIRLENISVFRNRNSMCFLISSNRGAVEAVGNSITWLENSRDIISSWRDGYHCKSNAVGPSIRKCVSEGLLDDSINMSSDPFMISKVVDESTFEFYPYAPAAGSEIGFLFPDTGRWVDGVKIKSASGRIVHTDRPVSGVKTGLRRAHKDYDSTQIYDLGRVNSGFEISGCRFGMQRRNAILARAFGGVVEGNVFALINANAITLSNETGWFFEGPYPRDIKIRGNKFVNPWGHCIFVGTQSRGNAALESDVEISGNEFVCDVSTGKKTPVFVHKLNGVKIFDNKFVRSDGSAFETAAQPVKK